MVRAGLGAVEPSPQSEPFLIVRPSFSSLSRSASSAWPSHDLLQDLHHVPGADPAGDALAARFLLGEGQEIFRHVDDAGVGIDHDEPARTHDRAGRGQMLVIDRRVQELLGQAAARRPAGLDGLERLQGPAADVEDHLPESHAQRHLDQSRPPDLADQREGLRALARLRPVAGVPLRAVPEDVGERAQRLDVVDDRRLAVERRRRRGTADGCGACPVSPRSRR